MPSVTASFTINRPGLEREVVATRPRSSVNGLCSTAWSGQLYEPETSLPVDLLLQPGDTFIDIGGHVGLYSMLAAGLVGPTGRVYVFEPERANYAHLLTHIALNHFHHVFPFPWAVGHSTSIVDFSRTSTTTVGTPSGILVDTLSTSAAANRSPKNPYSSSALTIFLEARSPVSPSSLRSIPRVTRRVSCVAPATFSPAPRSPPSSPRSTASVSHSLARPSRRCAP